MPNMTALADSLLVEYFNVVTRSNAADSGDIVAAASMPIFMLQ